MSQKLVVVEANEVPPRVFEEYAKRFPQSAIAHLLREAVFGATVADDVEEDFLYPSQSWASFNTGLPYSSHKVHWYNDPKDFGSFYWHAAAKKGLATVLVNTLHSSPLQAYAHEGNYAFVIPDCFSPDSETIPQEFSAFQGFNRAVTVANGRKSSLSSVLLSSASSFTRRPIPGRWGLDLASFGDVLRCAAGAALGRVERVRNAQFPLLASMFLKAMRQTDAALSVLFSNHVAANQHRYWYALYPSDYTEAVYDERWVRRYELEIINAMSLLDRWLAKIVSFCMQTDRALIVTSSMGQTGNRKLSKESTKRSSHFRVAEPDRFARHVFPPGSRWTNEAAMVPQYAFKFGTEAEAEAAHQHASIALGEMKGLSCKVEHAGSKVTLTVGVVSEDDMEIVGKHLTLGDLGVERISVDDHHSGRHHPIGSLIVYNDKSNAFRSWHGGATPYLRYAPALREYLLH